jgi:hypothetical protein
VIATGAVTLSVVALYVWIGVKWSRQVSTRRWAWGCSVVFWPVQVLFAVGLIALAACIGSDPEGEL